jgi:PAS domain-containing protein
MVSPTSTDAALNNELDRLLEALDCPPRGTSTAVETLRRLRKELPARLAPRPTESAPAGPLEVEAPALEARFRHFFDVIDEGFCIIEVLFDDSGKALDYRFLEINPAFEKHTGLAQAVGKRMRELAPEHDEHWFQIYGHVALTLPA